MAIPLAYLILAADAVLGPLLIVLLSGELPDPVAARFGTGGVVASHMSKHTYMGLMAALAALLPSVMALAFSWAPRNAPRLLNLPNKAQWMANGIPPRLLGQLDLVAMVLSSASVAFLVALHWLIVQAHRLSPPQLDMALFWPALVGFIGIILACTAWITFTFQRRLPPA